jgi:tetratricopeptide (TPR) repeat protein
MVLILAFGAGCSSPAEQLEETRKAASQDYNEALAAFSSGDRAAAEQKFTMVLERGGINPDLYCDAMLRRAVCWAAAGKFDEALADLQTLQAGGGPPDQILAARSYVLGKQGKAAEARAALAKARQYNRTVQEFKD